MEAVIPILVIENYVGGFGIVKESLSESRFRIDCCVKSPEAAVVELLRQGKNAETWAGVAVTDLRLDAASEAAPASTIARVRAVLPEARILVHSFESSYDAIKMCLKAGAVGYVYKGDEADLKVAVVAVYGGGEYLSRAACAAVRQDPFDELTSRQREVADLMAMGLKNKEIAAELHIAVGTVENVVTSIFSKLGVRNRTEAGGKGWGRGGHSQDGV